MSHDEKIIESMQLAKEFHKEILFLSVRLRDLLANYSELHRSIKSLVYDDD